MAGLGFAAAQQQPPQQQMPQQAQPAPMQGEEASPEEQALYNKVVSAAMLGLYDKSVLPQIVQTLKGSDDPAGGIAEVAATMAMRVFTFAQEEGTTIPGDVMLHAGKEIVEVVAEIAERLAGLQVDEAMIEEAYYRALDRFRSMAQQQGLYGEDAMQEDVAMLRQMKQDGRLDQVMAHVKQMQGAA